MEEKNYATVESLTKGNVWDTKSRLSKQDIVSISTFPQDYNFLTDSLNEIKENITYASEEDYKKIYNVCSNDDILDYLDEKNYVTSEDEDRVISENSDSIDRLRYFIGDTYSAEIYRLDGYGNLENVTGDDLQGLCDDLVKELKSQIQELKDSELM